MLMRSFLIPSFFLLAVMPVHGTELFTDLALKQGLNLSAVHSGATPLILEPILQQPETPDPAWRLAQWGTQYSLEGAPVSVQNDGTRVMKNAAKEVVIHPGGLAGQGVTLTVNGGVEYGGGLRKKGEPWPHLLVEQRFETPVRLADYGTAPFRLDFRVERCEVATEKTVDPGAHTGQITAFFTVHNKNAESSDFNDMIWFGLPMFDVRYDLPPGHQALDIGKDDATGKFICTLPGKDFYQGATGDGKWHALRGDLVSLLQDALTASQAKGFLTHTAFEDLQLTSFNLGWEVPGPYDCEITLKGLSLKGEG